VGITAFTDAIKRRAKDPGAPLRLKKGRGDAISQMLIETIRKDKSRDLAGCLFINITTNSSGYCVLLREVYYS